MSYCPPLSVSSNSIGCSALFTVNQRRHSFIDHGYPCNRNYLKYYSNYNDYGCIKSGMKRSFSQREFKREMVSQCSTKGLSSSASQYFSPLLRAYSNFTKLPPRKQKAFRRGYVPIAVILKSDAFSHGDISKEFVDGVSPLGDYFQDLSMVSKSFNAYTCQWSSVFLDSTNEIYYYGETNNLGNMTILYGYFSLGLTSSTVVPKKTLIGQPTPVIVPLPQELNGTIKLRIFRRSLERHFQKRGDLDGFFLSQPYYFLSHNNQLLELIPCDETRNNKPISSTRR